MTVDDNDTPAPALTVTLAEPVHGDVDGSGDVTLGDTLSYQATASNSGNVPLTEVTVSAALVGSAAVSCATLGLGESCTWTGTYTVEQADVDAGEVENTATADAAEAQAVTASRTTQVAQQRALTLTKTTETVNFGSVGEEIEYRYGVANSGTVTLAGTVTISDDKIATGITCDTFSPSGLAPGGTVSCTGTYAVEQADVDAGLVTNRATATLAGVTAAEATVTVHWSGQQQALPQVTLDGVSAVREDEETVSVPVTLSRASAQTVSVGYETADVTAAGGEDYTAADGTVTFAPGTTSGTITVAVTDDAVDEGEETFTIRLKDEVNATLGSVSTLTVTITDNDTAGIVLLPETLGVTEGGSATYTVELATEPSGQVTVTVDGTAGTDLTVVNGSLTFTDSTWNTAQTVEVRAGEDDDGTNDSATLTHTGSGADYGSVTEDLPVTVTDDDTAGIVLTPTTLGVTEGGSATYTVELATEPSGEVTVTVGGASGTDLTVATAAA